MQIYLFQLANGIGLGMIYFLMASGLSILFGLMRFVNFAHGAFFLIGAYVCYATTQLTDSFWLAFVLAPAFVALFAWAMNRVVFQRVMSLPHSAHILITFGAMLVIQEGVVSIWGPMSSNVSIPASLAGAIFIGPIVYPTYRLFVIAVAAVVALALYFVLEKTKTGAILRAASQESSMVSLLGINVNRVFSIGFALSGGLAGLAGVLSAPLRGVDPAMGVEALGISFAVVVVGGLGSFTGSLAGGLLVGIVQSMMSMLWPEGARLMIYLGVAAVLVLRPNGLLGRA